jgi:hypothetical protein
MIIVACPCSLPDNLYPNCTHPRQDSQNRNTPEPWRQAVIAAHAYSP